MGRRIKKEIQTVRVDTENQLLKRLQQQALNRAESYANGGFAELSESEAKRMRQSVEDRKKLDGLYPRGRHIRDISSGACVDLTDVGRMSWGMSDEELEQAARDANNIYQEIETELNFDSKLSREQIEILLPVMNEFIFDEALSVDDVLRLLECKQEKPVSVKSNALISYLFGELSRNKWICQNWQKVAELNKCFLGRRGNVLTQKTLSNAPTKYCRARGMLTDNILNQDIFDAVSRLKR